YRLAEFMRVAVAAVGEQDVAGHLVVDGARDELERELVLGLEDEVLRNLTFATTRAVVRPTLRQIQREVDGHVGRPRRDAQAHGDLAVGDLARAAGVLPLYTDRVRALFQKPRVVDDPRPDRLLFGQRGDRVLRGDRANVAIAPRRVAQKAQQPMM